MNRTQQERRARRRFILSIPVTVTRREAEFEMSSGVARDVSSSGIYFYSSNAYSAGQRIQFTLTLPMEITLTDPMTLDCVGRILRVEGSKADKYGVAVSIERFHFAA